MVLLFGFRGGNHPRPALLIALIFHPIVLQSYGIFALAYAWSLGLAFTLPYRRALRLDWNDRTFLNWQWRLP